MMKRWKIRFTKKSTDISKKLLLCLIINNGYEVLQHQDK